MLQKLNWDRREEAWIVETLNWRRYHILGRAVSELGEVLVYVRRLEERQVTASLLFRSDPN